MLLRGGRVCDYNKNEIMDVRIDGSIITEIGNLSPRSGEKVLDCRSFIVLPALIDIGIYTKNKALNLQNLYLLDQDCARGGVGTVILGADSIPSLSNPTMLEYITLMDKHISTHLYASVPGATEGKVLDLSVLNSSGSKLLSIVSEDLRGHRCEVIIHYAKMLKLPIFITPIDCEMAQGVLNAGELAFNLGLREIPDVAYTKEVALSCEVSRISGIEMVMQLFDSDSFKLANFANENGARIFTQTSIHHLLLEEMVCDDYNTYAKMYPPLRSSVGQKELLSTLKRDEVFFLTSLQKGYESFEKDRVFDLASDGVNEIKYYFSLLYTGLVKSGVISLSKLLSLTSRNQAQILGLNKGEIASGFDADLIVVDPNSSFVCPKDSAYSGKTLYSKVFARVISGEVSLLEG